MTVDDRNTGPDADVIDVEPIGDDGAYQVRPQAAPRPVWRGSLYLTTGAVLLTTGLMMLAMRLSDTLDQGGAVLVVGAALLVAWALRATYGLLIPAAILVALGVGEILAADNGESAKWIALGVGFIAIFVLDFVRMRATHWWPLVPGAVLIAAGLSDGSSLWEHLGDYIWPVLLIALGLLFVIGALARRGRSTD